MKTSTSSPIHMIVEFLKLDLNPCIKSESTFMSLFLMIFPMQYNNVVNEAAKGIKQTKNSGKYVVTLLIPINIKNNTVGILTSINIKLSVKNQKT